MRPERKFGTSLSSCFRRFHQDTVYSCNTSYESKIPPWICKCELDTQMTKITAAPHSPPIQNRTIVINNFSPNNLLQSGGAPGAPGVPIARPTTGGPLKPKKFRLRCLFPFRNHHKQVLKLRNFRLRRLFPPLEITTNGF